ncbi:MAG: NAD(P)/FAD-dependent oxidoreductase, partial [Saprospiraceae bacterium]
STRNAGFACFGSISELLEDLQTNTEDQVFQIASLRYRGLQKLRNRIGDQKLQYQELGGMEIFRSSDRIEFEKCLDAIPYFNKIVEEITGKKKTYRLMADDSSSKFGFHHIDHIIQNTAEGQIHTGEMMKSLMILAHQHNIFLLNGLSIQSLNDTGTEVELLSTEGWTFTAQRLLVCTNGFAAKLLPKLDVQPARNQVIITTPIKDLKVKGCFHYDRGYYYFRNIDNRILLGGGRNLDFSGEQTAEFGTSTIIQDALQILLSEVVLPDQQVEIERSWSGIMGLGPVKKPIIEKVSPNIAVAVRMGGMGVAIGSLVGEMGAELIM